MRENVTISYRGANYELGRGRQFYGIWPVGAPPQAPPLEWWPETTEGWYGAWARFTGIEAPGTVAPVSDRPAPKRRAAGEFPVEVGSAGPGGIAAAALLGIGVLLGIVGLFPQYFAGQSLAQQSTNLVPHIIYLVAWAGSAALILLGGRRMLAGALLGTGTSIVTFGLFLADIGTAASGGGHGTGLILGSLGWLFCAVGAVVAFRLRPPGGPAGLRGLPGVGVLTVVVGTLAALGAVASFAPSWDSYTLRTATGGSATITAGNAFSNAGLVITGDVLVMVALVIAAVAAVAWRPARLGAVLLAGALVPMVAQAISAAIQIGQAASPAQFGFSPAQAAAAGLTIHSSLTAAFWIYCIFLVALIATCLWLLVQSRVPGSPVGGTPPAGSPAGHPTAMAAGPIGPANLTDTVGLASPADTFGPASPADTAGPASPADTAGPASPDTFGPASPDTFGPASPADTTDTVGPAGSVETTAGPVSSQS